MTFAHPLQFLWLIAVALLAGICAWALRSARQNLLALIELPVLNKIFPYEAWRKRATRKALLRVLGALLVALALAGPQIGRRLETIRVKGSDVFILFDCSASMLAEDFKPNRLEKSKRLLTGLLEKLHGGRVGIIAFAGEPYVYCPLTFDVATAKRFLKSIEAGMVPEPGTRIGAALRLAAERTPGENGSGAVVILTDGEDHDSDPLGAAEEAKKKGLRVFAIGIGNPEGEPIPERDAAGNVTGYRKNKKGEVVLSKLDEATLARIATETGGSYFRASATEQEIDLLAEQLSRAEKNPMLRKRGLHENRYQWLLLLGLVLLIAAESLDFLPLKAAKAGAALIAAIFLSSAPAEAGFIGKMREGNRLYEREKYEEAVKSYEKAQELKPSDPRASFNKGAALYRLQEWEQAKEEFQRSSVGSDASANARALYNLGNNFFQQQNYKEAAEAYRQSLKLNPYDEDARHNLRLALKRVQTQPPQKQKPDKKESQTRESKGGQGREDGENDERRENAKRILKGAAGDEGGKPLFKPDAKGKKRRDNEADW